MNIVIFSASFLPLNGPESFCATRFASALARRGHRVHVITLQAKSSVSEEVYHALVDDSVKITVVPFSPRRRSLLSQLRYCCANWETAIMPELIAATRRALVDMKDPILVTRTYPVSSLVVGWYCRKYAKKWICHLSDPIPHAPWLPNFSLLPNRLKEWLKWCWIRKWIARGLVTADAVSVTCPGVLRYYKERYPESFGKKPAFVTTHIGDNRLSFLALKPFERTFSGKMILYAGELYDSRKMDALADAILKLNKNGNPCTLVHVGKGNAVDSALKDYPAAYLRYPDNPGMAVSAAKVADVLYVTDSITGLPYSPQILSKFVYQLYEDKPLLVETSVDGIMHQCSVDYPEAGIFWVDRDNLDTMNEALKKALECDSAKIDRSRVRRAFSEETIVKKFESDIAALG